MFAAELQRAVPDQSARKQSGLAQNLEAVADSKDGSALSRKVLHLLHDGAEPRNRSGAEIIPIAETTWNDHSIGPTQGCFLMPHQSSRMAHHISQDVHSVLVTIRGRKLENGKIHESFNFKTIIFNHRVAENLVAGFVNLFASQFFIGAREFDFHVFANVNGTDISITHVCEGVLDGFALRIQDRFFWSHNYLCFHWGWTGDRAVLKILTHSDSVGETICPRSIQMGRYHRSRTRERCYAAGAPLHSAGGLARQQHCRRWRIAARPNRFHSNDGEP